MTHHNLEVQTYPLSEIKMMVMKKATCWRQKKVLERRVPLILVLPRHVQTKRAPVRKVLMIKVI